MTKSFGLYFHIPFCRSKCPYCDFYSIPYTEEQANRYTEAVLRALSKAPERDLPVDTIYFGGGTPVLFGAQRLLTMIDAVRKRYVVSDDCEITLEANPAAMTLEDLRTLRKGGFNRISIGVQSAVEEQLKTLGRLHSVQQARESVELCRIAGFENVSVDLMLGTPGQTEEAILRFCDTFCPVVEHISAYLLKVEENTPFGRQQMERFCPDEEQSADLYLFAVKELESRGFHQYEISNFAKDGLHSRHNSRYWDCSEYLGIGPAAHSFWKGQRKYFERDLESFSTAEDPWQLWQLDEEGGDFFEYAMLRLRLNEGLRFADCRERYPEINLAPLKQQAQQLIQHGLAVMDEEHIALTVQGFLLSNAAIWRLLEVYD
ncbi:MAG: radical SAM family heme chaperone HemW [Oscillospiraceae bacterium]|nr:radical SAM family heme chaperone HemW [Oscillospiraceae bacterium]